MKTTLFVLTYNEIEGYLLMEVRIKDTRLFVSISMSMKYPDFAFLGNKLAYFLIQSIHVVVSGRKTTWIQIMKNENSKC